MIVVCRMLMGVFEAGFFPCCVVLLSSWYQRYKVQQRYVVSRCRVVTELDRTRRDWISRTAPVRAVRIMRPHFLPFSVLTRNY